MQLQPGTLLQGDRYRIIDVLGQGGFGITYLAEQVMAERKVCIKEFFPKEYYNRNEDSRSISLGTQGSAEIMELYKAKFIKEAKTIAKLDHPNIIHIHDVFAENNTAYYVMEYIDGESLSALVKERGALPESEAISYIKQVAAALGSIHEQRIMHLDIKPANIMLRKNDGKPVLIDFGLSKQYDAEGNQTSSTPVGISAGYAPMEQYQQGGVREFSPETDIYSLGATLYYLVTGEVPPQAASVVDNGLPELPAHLSANVRNAIERSMEVQRKRRPHSIKEFLALLEDNNPVIVPVSAPQPTPAPVSEETAFGAPASNAADDRTVVSTPAPKAQPTQQPKKEWVPKYAVDKPKKSEETKKKSKWWLWLLIIAVVAIGGYLALSSSNDSETAKSEQVQNRQAEEAEKARIAEEKHQAEETEKARKAEEKRKVEEAKPVLTLTSSQKINAKHTGDSGTIYFSLSDPNASIQVYDNADWLSINWDGDSIKWSATANDFNDTRNATITVACADSEFKVYVTQDGKPKPKHSTYTENVSGLNMKMVWVDGGTFNMGSYDGPSNERPVHQVTLDGYWIAETEVTQAQWKAVMGTNIEYYIALSGFDYLLEQPGRRGMGDIFPMYCVNYFDALAFCNKLSQLTGKNYVLPTEAQWEFAARGGNKSKGYKYSGGNSIDAVAWYANNSKLYVYDFYESNQYYIYYIEQNQPVKRKSANELGLYDMSGNVWEWCNDLYGAYTSNSEVNPTGSHTGNRYVLRGGNTYNEPYQCTVSYRDTGNPNSRYTTRGFRVVCLP